MLFPIVENWLVFHQYNLYFLLKSLVAISIWKFWLTSQLSLSCNSHRGFYKPGIIYQFSTTVYLHGLLQRLFISRISFFMYFLLPDFNNTENHIRTLICWLFHLIFLNRLNSFSWQYFYLQIYHFSFFSPFFPVFQVTLGGISTVKGVYLVLKSLHWGIFMTSLTWILSVPILLGDSSVIWRPQTISNQNILIKRVFSGKG